ncbi:site-specific integrase [Sandarakinorhabdus sp.]|uniref:tyrosine-type recombinase/integrase n=1 Tax=Sandarakinorhabdus sp. TaxID=1916663 RepID=UPI00286E2833|nr:site-specific integrase [Sandarakinorhabdus sp.]
MARFRASGHSTKGYVKSGLGEADDTSDADGERILDFKQAQTAARVWFYLVTAGDRPSRVPAEPYTVGKALDDYMEQFTGKSVAATRSRVDVIIRPELSDVDTAKLTVGLLTAWLRKRSEAPARVRTASGATKAKTRVTVGDEGIRRRRSTANRDFTVLKAALNVAFRDGHIASDHAWRKVKPFKNVDSAKLRFLTDDELKRLVNATDADFRPVVQAALLTGARYGNIVKSTVRNFDPEAKTLGFETTKGGRAHIVYLEEEGAALFKRAAMGKQPGDLLFPKVENKSWGASEQGRKLDAASLRANIERATFHDLRRTFGARLARQGVPMAIIAQALGQADQRITLKHYAHLAPSHVSAAIRQYAAGLGIVEKENVVSLSAA